VVNIHPVRFTVLNLFPRIYAYRYCILQCNCYVFQYAAKYQFGYQVRDPKHGTFLGHVEARDGHHTKGHYHVLLPDGRLQNVQYWADLSGYHAQVTYNAAAKHSVASHR